MRSVALCTRELHPFVGGGIAPIVSALAAALADDAEVTLITSGAHRLRYSELRRDGPVFDDRIRVVFVDEPAAPGGFYGPLHAWSHALLEGLVAAFPDGGPDLAEFPDYLGEGFVTVQAKRTADPRLRNTTVAARLHTTNEMVHVLNAHLPDDLETRAVYDMERYVLQHADVLLWPGGDVLASYERFYDGALAPGVEIPDAFLVEGGPLGEPVAESGPLRLLYLGRMERRKGVLGLVRALGRLETADWQLTLVGADTDTAPLGASMTAQLELMTAGDDRFRLLAPVPRAEVGRLIASHDAVVVPSRWECWPNVAREALLHDRPVIGTPVGGLVAFVRPGVSGWLARDTSVEALVEVLEPLAREPEQVRALSRSGSPRTVLDELADPAMIRDRYAELERRPAAPPPPGQPLVSVVIPYFQLDRFVEATVASVAAQTYSNIETIVVNDGAVREVDRVLLDLGVRVVTQRNRGLGAARNFGIAVSRGAYVLPLDADDLLEPDFVAATVAALEADPGLAYCGTWSTFVDESDQPLASPGYAPLGNWASLTERQNVAGTASSLFRRSLFDAGFRYSEDLTSYEDWMLFLELRRAGHLGAILPRPLLRYRIRGDSMLRATGITNEARIQAEIAAHLAEGSIQWTS